jgi:hypothetical protein
MNLTTTNTIAHARREVKRKSLDVKDLPPFAGKALTATELRRKTTRKVGKRRLNQREIASKLRDEAIKQGDWSSVADGDLLFESSSKESGNLAVFENLCDKQNRSFTCPVQFVALPTRLDSASQRKASYPSRKRIQTQFQREDIRQKIEDKKLFAYFITPTYVNLIGRTFEESLLFHEELSRQFRELPYYQRIFIGSFRKTDFTCGNRLKRIEENRAFDYRIDGYNHHGHYAAVCSIEFADTTPSDDNEDEKQIDTKLPKRNIRLAKIYTELGKKVHLEMFGCDMEGIPKEGYFRLDIRPIDLETNGDPRKGIAFEMAKYLTHSQAFLEFEPSELVSANRILKNRKLLTSTGIFNNKKGRRKIANSDKQKDLAKTAKIDNTSRDFINRISSMSANNPAISEKIRLSVLANLDSMPLKQIGIRLCASGNRKTWLEILPDLFKTKVIEARNRFLSRFPNAVITDLKGNVYGAHRRNYSKEELERNLLPEIYRFSRKLRTLH